MAATRMMLAVGLWGLQPEPEVLSLQAEEGLPDPFCGGIGLCRQRRDQLGCIVLERLRPAA
jgi:hypothetical protein